MSPTRVILSPTGIARLARTAEMELCVRSEAEEIADRVRAIAPYDPDSDGPHYRDSIVVETEDVGGIMTAHVVATVDHADDVEFGTDDTPTFAPLRRAAEGG